jgi:hypothetical protein
MFSKKYVVYFAVLFIPMLIVSTLINLVYSLQVHEYIQIDWLAVILLAIVIDALITWIQTRGEQKDSGK